MNYERRTKKYKYLIKLLIMKKVPIYGYWLIYFSTKEEYMVSYLIHLYTMSRGASFILHVRSSPFCLLVK